MTEKNNGRGENSRDLGTGKTEARECWLGGTFKFALDIAA
jgi:hypothetical protein